MLEENILNSVLKQYINPVDRNTPGNVMYRSDKDNKYSVKVTWTGTYQTRSKLSILAPIAITGGQTLKISPTVMQQFVYLSVWKTFTKRS